MTLPLRVWLLLSHFVVLALPLAAILVTGTLVRELRMESKGDLLHQGATVARLVRPWYGGGLTVEPPEMAELIARIEADTASRVRLLDGQGVVLVSSDPADLGTSLASRPEVQAALGGEQGDALRPLPEPAERAPLSSPQRGALERMTVTMPVYADADAEVGDRGPVLGVVEVSRNPRELFQALYHMSPTLSWGVLLAVLLTIGLALAAGHFLSRSLRALSRASHRIAEGSLVAVAELERPANSHLVEVRALSADMATMAVKLRERLGYISEFAGNVSHEFKTPITTLRGTVELLQDDQDMPAEQRERFLGNALSELQRMERLVSGLLDLARAEESDGGEPVDLDALLAEVAARYPGVQLVGRAGSIQGRRAQVGAVAANLVENALRYGGDDVSVKLVAWRDGGRAGLEVIDDGPGITQSNLARIFDRFFTTDRARGGTGLGLALVATICRAHGGGVEVESQPGHTRFRAWFAVDPSESRPGHRRGQQ